MLYLKNTTYLLIIVSLVSAGILSAHIHLDMDESDSMNITTLLNDSDKEASEASFECNQNTAHYHCSHLFYMNNNLISGSLKTSLFLYNRDEDNFLSRDSFPPAEPPKA